MKLHFSAVLRSAQTQEPVLPVCCMSAPRERCLLRTIRLCSGQQHKQYELRDF